MIKANSCQGLLDSSLCVRPRGPSICVTRSSCIKSGQSVLVIDPVDTYGTDFSSFSLAALDALVAARQQAGLQASCSGSSEPSASPVQQQLQHEHSVPPAQPFGRELLPPGCRLRPVRQDPLPLLGLRAFRARRLSDGSSDELLSPARSYILDLAPKVGSGTVYMYRHTCMRAGALWPHALQYAVVHGHAGRGRAWHLNNTHPIPMRLCIRTPRTITWACHGTRVCVCVC